jgi:hypothetical protein
VPFALIDPCFVRYPFDARRANQLVEETGYVRNPVPY